MARTFKTKYFAKQARKAAIKDSELCRAIKALAEGKGVDLFGGVYKQRLDANRHRSIILAKSDNYWIFEFLFAKKDTANITDTALDGFRAIADAYSALRPSQLQALLDNGDLEEICHEPIDDKEGSPKDKRG